MSVLRSMAAGLRSLFRKERAEMELDEELTGFLEMAAEEKMKEGMTRQEAFRAARLAGETFVLEFARCASPQASRQLRSSHWGSALEPMQQFFPLYMRSCSNRYLLRTQTGLSSLKNKISRAAGRGIPFRLPRS
jgi:hypothetical protein